MFLLDTNVFLEIILGQDNKEKCKTFLNNHFENLNLSDFSLHSIGVILFRYKKEDIFQKLIEDIIPSIKLLSLPYDQYTGIVKIRKNLSLDFDDAYQYIIAKYYGLKIVTMDKDFENIKDLEVIFL